MWDCRDRNLCPGRATCSVRVRSTETTFDGRAESTRSPEKVWPATVDPAGHSGPLKIDVTVGTQHTTGRMKFRKCDFSAAGRRTDVFDLPADSAESPLDCEVA